MARLVVLRLVLDSGEMTQAEAVPVRYVTGETPEGALQAVRNSAPSIRGLSLLDSAHWQETLQQFQGASLRAGIEMALHTARAAMAGQSLWRYFGSTVAELVTDVTISLGEDAPSKAQEALQAGFKVLKVKLGVGDPFEDLRRILEIHEAAPNALLRLDANQAFSARAALQLLQSLAARNLPIQLVEQPVDKHDLEALDLVAAESPYPVFADEAVVDPPSAEAVLNRTRVHGLNVKIMKSGVRGTLQIARMAKNAGRNRMIGCMLETSRGIGFAAALAAGSGLFDFVDLDSHLLLSGPADQGGFEQCGAALRCLDVPPRLQRVLP